MGVYRDSANWRKALGRSYRCSVEGCPSHDLSPGASSRNTRIMRRKNRSVKDRVRSNSSSLGDVEPCCRAAGASANRLFSSAFSRVSRDTSPSRAARSSALARHSDIPSLTVQKDTAPVCLSRRRKPPSAASSNSAPAPARWARRALRQTKEPQQASKWLSGEPLSAFGLLIVSKPRPRSTWGLNAATSMAQIDGVLIG